MECEKCEGGIVVGSLTVPVSAPLNRKGGGLQLAGVAVKQADIRNSWDITPNEERSIHCNNSECGQQYSYVPGTGIVPVGDGQIDPPAPKRLAMAPTRAVPSPVRTPVRLAAPVRAAAPIRSR